ncbi:MAG: phenylalanine--tRNA ligase subunit beta, partial [Gemmatimonadales bacterium]
MIRGLEVGPSPDWLRERVTAVGVRSINNVVDATNYVMLELNQPMHAYDIARLEGPAVIARKAKAGEALVTLDDVQRTLSDDMTVIADAGGSIGVAGVMGAAHVEVAADTTDLFLECAWFEPRSIRRTRRALGLSTEASYRFERGVDLQNGPEAIRRCVALILATAGGTPSGAPVDLWPRVTHPARIFVRPARVAQVLGVDLPWNDLEKALTTIGATVLAKPNDARIAVDVPGWRPDLEREIDLIEEIARIHGYDNFPDELRPYRPGSLRDTPSEDAIRRVREGLVARGMMEVQTLPMGPASGDKAVALLNPLSAEDGYLRAELMPALGRQVELNWANHTRNVRLFETGIVFGAPERPGGAPRETLRVAGVITGSRLPAHWSDAGETADMDRWDLKGLLEDSVALAVPGATVQVEEDSWVARHPDGREAGRAARLRLD